MAPRRGGGGSSGGSGSGLSVSCPYAFQDSVYSPYSTPIVYFVSYCLFFVLTLAVLISLCCIRKRHGNAKRLVGPIFLLALLCMLTGYALLIIATMLRECGTTSFYSFYDWAIAFNIFFRLSTYLLLVVVVYGVNSLLRERLGSGQSLAKIISLSILGFMGALTCGYIGLQSYNTWTNTEDGMQTDADPKGIEQEKLATAYYVFYLLSVIAGGGLSVATIVSMRSRRIPVGDLLGWIIALIFCMFIWVLFSLVEVASSLQNNYLGETTYQAFEYLIDFFQTFSFIAVLFLAKSRAWDVAVPSSDMNQNPNMYENSSYPEAVQYAPVPHPHPQQQYAYNAQPGQQYYYQQQPVYNGAPAPVNGNGHVVHVK